MKTTCKRINKHKPSAKAVIFKYAFIAGGLKNLLALKHGLIFIFMAYLSPILAQMDDAVALKSPNGFVENKGQFRDQHGNPNPDVLYVADFGGMKVLLRKDGFSYETYQVKPKWVDPATIPYKIIASRENGESFESWPGKLEAEKQQMYHFHRVDVKIDGCNRQLQLKSAGTLVRGKKWLIIDSNSHSHHANCYSRMTYSNIYQDIDLVCFIDSVSGCFKYDLVVGQGADISQIKLTYEGAERLKIDSEGRLVISTRFGDMTENIPACYLENFEGERMLFDGISFSQENNTIGFHSRKSFSNKLIIDPSINFLWAENYGGDSADYCVASVVNPSGDIFMCGTTKSLNIATAGAWQDSIVLPDDGFLMRIAHNGQIDWTTYLSGFIPADLELRSDNSLILINNESLLCMNQIGGFLWQILDEETRVAVASDANNNIITVGDSVVKRNSLGIVEWKKKIGGPGTSLKDVGIDSQGNIYFAGHTTDSSGLATDNSFLNTYNGTNLIGTGWDYNWELVGLPRAGDACFGKITPGGTLEFTSYYGGHFFDEASKIAVSESGNFAIVGSTNSRNGIATPGVYQDTLRPQGVYCFSLIAIGPNPWDCPEGYWQYLDTCINGCFPPYPLYDNYCQSTDAFIALFNNQGSRIFGTYYGDTDCEFGIFVAINSGGDTITLSGVTTGNKPACYDYNAVPRPFIYYPPNIATPYSMNQIGAESWVAQLGAAGNRISGTYYPPIEDYPVQFIEPKDVSHKDGAIRVSFTVNEQWSSENGYNWSGFDAMAGCLMVSDFEIDTIINPLSNSPCIGESAIFKTSITTSPNRNLNFQWFHNYQMIPEATDSIFVIQSTSISDSGHYYCKIAEDDFIWWTTEKAHMYVRESPAVSYFQLNNSNILPNNARLLSDMDFDGFLDVIHESQIVFNEQMLFNKYQNIPVLYYYSSCTDVDNNNEPDIYSLNPFEFQPNIGSKIIRTLSNGFEVIENSLLFPVTSWADFDNDGRYEGFKLSGNLSGSTDLYIVNFDNDLITQSHVGTDDSIILHNPSINTYHRTDAADWDQDGDIDILLISSYVHPWGAYRDKYLYLLSNNEGYFSSLQIIGQDSAFRDVSAQWFDNDSDGDMDIMVNYCFCTAPYCEFQDLIINVFENNNGELSLIYSDTAIMDRFLNIQVKPIIFDYNNDGILDFGYRDQIWVKTASGYNKVPTTFNPTHTGLTGLIKNVGDIDKDGDLDLLSSNGLFLNDVCNPPNTSPTAPFDLSELINYDTVQFSWQRATDLETPQLGLTYNLRVGTTPGGNDIMSSLSDSTGWRKVVGMGNVFQNTGWWLHSLAPGTYYWSVQAIDNSFTGGPFAPEQSFTICSSPPAIADAIIGETVFCLPANGITFFVNTIEHATSYIWTLPPGATGNSTTNSITVNFGLQAISGEISVKGVNDCGEGEAAILFIEVIPLPDAAASIVGNSIICAGSSNIVYYIEPVQNATAYVWLLPNGASGTSTTNSISVDYGSSATSGNITVKGINLCGEGAGSTLPITVNLVPMAAGEISGSSIVCQGQNAVIYIVPALDNATSYVWTLPNGAAGTSATNSISVNYGSSATSGNITVKGINSCGEGAGSTLPITVNPMPMAAGVISGSSIVCQGQNAVAYTVSAIINTTSYIWTLPNGASGTSTTNSISVDYSSSATSGNITVKGINSCGEGAGSTLPITINHMPTATGVISGSSIVCQGQNAVAYTVPVISNATSYVWTLPNGASGASTTNSISVDYSSSATSGNITVKGINSCGEGAGSTLAITVNPLPASAGVITGSTTVCQASTQSYSVANVTGMSYSWTAPTGWTINSGQGTNSIFVTVGSSPGNITVTPSNSCGSGNSSTLAVEVNNVPNQPSEIIGNVNPCEGYTGIYSVTNVVGVSYNWTIPTGAVFIDGQGTNSVVVNMGATGGNIIVTPSNTCGNGLARSLAVIVNNPPSETPSQALGPETVNTYTTISSLYTTNAVADANYYIWDLFPTDAGVLSTGNDTSVTITWNASFIGNCALMVKAVNNCGESQYSIPKIIYVDYITSLDEVKNNPITIFPNPSDGIFTVKSEFPMESMLLKDVTGKVVLHPIPDNSYSVNINLQSFAKGIYFLEIKHRYGKERLKLILIEN